MLGEGGVRNVAGVRRRDVSTQPATRAPRTNPPWDAVIVGARVAGASTGRLLARAGLRVLVVERAGRGSDTVYAHALMRGGVLQLHRWGLLDRVLASGAAPVRRLTFHYGPESLSVSLKPHAGVDALYAPQRPVLDGILVDAAERAGARFRFGLTVADVTRDRGGRVNGVLLSDHRGATWTERADLVVGADGRSSAVAVRVAAPTIAVGHHSGAYAYGHWPAAGLDGYHWHYGHGLSAGAVPTNDGLACVFIGTRASVLTAALRHRSHAEAVGVLLAGMGGGLADRTDGPPAGPVKLFRGPPTRLRRAHGPGWALVGDAGWWMDPLSAHGITDALRDAELLASAVVAGSGSEAAAGRALAEYQSARDRLALAMHPIVDRLASHRWDPEEARALLRGLSSVMADEVESIGGFDRPPALIA